MPQSKRAEMSAIPQAIIAEFCPLAEAAMLLGKNDGHLRRMCGQQLQAQGFAIIHENQWYIRRAWNPEKLSADPRHREPNLSAFTKEQIGGAYARRAIVLEFRQKRIKDGPIAQWFWGWLEEKARQYPNVGASRSQAYRWDDD